MDFDDLLVRTVNLLELFEDVRDRVPRIFRWVLVDEYQDTNRAQYRLLQLLAGERRQPDGGRRRFSVGLRLPRRRHPQHPRVRARLPGREGRQARAELPLDATILDAANGRDRPQPRIRRQAPLDRGGRGETDRRRRARRRARGGALHRRRDRAARRGGRCRATRSRSSTG